MEPDKGILEIINEYFSILPGLDTERKAYLARGVLCVNVITEVPELKITNDDYYIFFDFNHYEPWGSVDYLNGFGKLCVVKGYRFAPIIESFDMAMNSMRGKCIPKSKEYDWYDKPLLVDGPDL